MLFAFCKSLHSHAHVETLLLDLNKLLVFLHHLVIIEDGWFREPRTKGLSLGQFGQLGWSIPLGWRLQVLGRNKAFDTAEQVASELCFGVVFKGTIWTLVVGGSGSKGCNA